jgi:hypothetical protein
LWTAGNSFEIGNHQIEAFSNPTNRITVADSVPCFLFRVSTAFLGPLQCLG